MENVTILPVTDNRILIFRMINSDKSSKILVFECVENVTIVLGTNKMLQIFLFIDASIPAIFFKAESVLSFPCRSR